MKAKPDTATAPTFRVRFVTASSLFDGHDASINIMRRLLQTSGAEVIHLGHNRSVQDIVQAAIQEDAQAIAISSYQGGHVEFFKYIIDLLKDLKASHIRVFGGGGGTITPKEIKELENYGVCRLYSPEDGRKMGLDGIIQDMVKQAQIHPLKNIDWLTVGLGNSKALGQALTCIELGKEAFEEGFQSHLKDLEALQSKIKDAAKKATVVGITGTGGAGKSSLTDELVLRLLEHDAKVKVAVLAVDPTRRKTGGALLGDRLRMNSLSSPRCMMRSFATREENVSLSSATRSAVDTFSAAGFDWIIVESGGIGQADTSITEIADLSIYVMTSEFGAPTQLEKINMLDYADFVIINKFDKAGSLDALLDVRKQLRRNHKSLEKVALPQQPVFGTIASRFGDPGVTSAFQHLLKIAKKDRKNKPLPLDTDFDPGNPNAFSIVPRDRMGYLSEISLGVRRYHETVNKAVEQVALAESIDRVNKAGIADLKKAAEAEWKKVDPNVRTALDSFRGLKERYQKDTFEFEIRGHKLTVPLFSKTLSQNKIPRIALPRYQSKAELARFLMLENLPGYFPFTAGVFPFKRSEEDPKRQFAGEGTPTRTNKRFHLLCATEKAKRLSTAFDSVTLYGSNPDLRPDIYGKIGESGVSVCSVDDAKKLYKGFDLVSPSTSVSMTINGPAPMLLAFYFNTAIDQQVDLHQSQHQKAPNADERAKIAKDTLQKVRGTVQADILKEDQAQNTCIFSTEFALRMMGDIQQYFIDNQIRNYYSVSISGYHMAEAGANPISQLAFTLANGFTFVEYYLSRGMKVDDFAPNLSFFFSNALDPEYTVIGRVARRVWALALQERYGASERSQKLKYHIQTSGRSLHAQEISFNDIRTTLQALLAYFDHCNSLHTNAYDEAVTTPTEESVRRAMAIQLIISKEFGWAKTENPHQGSFLVEELTALVEEAVLKEFERLSLRGGVLGAMETQYQRMRIQEESLHYEKLKHSGELPLIGVNTFENPAVTSLEQMFPENLTRATTVEKQEQIENLKTFHKTHEKEAPEALAKLKAAASSGKNTFEALMDAARVCSLGQMTSSLYSIGGEYRRGM